MLHRALRALQATERLKTLPPVECRFRQLSMTALKALKEATLAAFLVDAVRERNHRHSADGAP
jgi:hypothetical protein